MNNLSLRGAQRRSNPSQRGSNGFTVNGLLRGVYPERSVRARNDRYVYFLRYSIKIQYARININRRSNTLRSKQQILQYRSVAFFEKVSHTRFGHDILWLSGVLFYLLAQM